MAPSAVDSAAAVEARPATEPLGHQESLPVRPIRERTYKVKGAHAVAPGDVQAVDASAQFPSPPDASDASDKSAAA
eukprot:CAMPEP_0202337874 /NCGR_PEP_ID=MMETSP1126-20121109/384_1 /ASSEMBLY_ACC=CAM_ASM_000457 /TAXON_ID=3047 /ORGANISM="Dunaliella tertiolecta, Strain CCMP1320" /LENGTH=75 /DNA_ID=CAMNT_0048928157 /DNA_START=86 /DNA_END=313 /DNA_ORIENTATION=+